MGIRKWQELGWDYDLLDVPAPSSAETNEFTHTLQEALPDRHVFC